MPLRRASFSFLLPVLSLALALTVIMVPATLGYVNMRSISRNGSAVTFHSKQFTWTVPRDRFFISALTSSAYTHHELIEATDMPAFSVELFIDRCSPYWPGGWTPHDLDFHTWRSLIYPIYCLPFWWFVGLGFDTLLQRRRLRWPVLLLGTLLCAFWLFLLLGLRFGLSPEEREGIVYPLWGFGFWALLFAVFPTAWVRQWWLSKPAPEPIFDPNA